MRSSRGGKDRRLVQQLSDVGRSVMKDPDPDRVQAENNRQPSTGTTPTNRHLSDRLMTTFEVAEFVGCHEESVRRAYLCGQLRRQRFGVRSWRFHPQDVKDWIARGAPTRIS
jgi:excisionase family DNA binding protein